MLADRADLTVGVAGTQHQVIGNGGEGGDMEDQDVIGLFLDGRLSDGNGSCFRLRYDRRPPDTNSFALYKIQRGAATGLKPRVVA